MVVPEIWQRNQRHVTLETLTAIAQEMTASTVLPRLQRSG